MVYLSRIYTRTGDQGDTALGDGTRVPKDHPRVAAYGGVDELNAVLGLLGALRPEQAARLESVIDRLNEPLAPLKSFVLPGGSPAAAWCHLARTVCRRAERDVVTLARAEPVNPEVVVYLNRLSDLLFVLARVYNNNGQDDVLWQPGKTQK